MINFPKKTKKILDRMIACETRPHSFLFVGSAGTGKAEAVQYFISRIVGGKGTTDFWERVQSGNHPDVILVRPEVKEEKGKKREREISISQIRSSIDQLKFFPYELGQKFCVIYRAQKMSLGAANALLKSLEEPRPQTCFVLICDEPEKLPQTIISRCALIRFPVVNFLEMEEWLEGMFLPEKERAQIRVWAAGRMGYAKKLVEEKKMMGEAEENKQNLEKIISADLSEAFLWAEQAGKNRVKAIDTLSFWEIELGARLIKKIAEESIKQCENSLRAVKSVRESINLLETTNASARVVLEKLALEALDQSLFP